MLGYFPNPFPDEPLYSVCARFRERSEYTSDRQCLNALFGADSVKGFLYTPHNLKHFLSVLPIGHSYSLKKILYYHTSVPYLQPFLPTPSLRQLIQQLLGLSGGQGLTLHQLAADGASSRYFRYCPQCVAVDRDQFGEAYWHRVHQMPGVLRCNIHNTVLHLTDLPIGTIDRLVTLENAIEENESPPCIKTVKESTTNSLDYIASQSDFLLNHDTFGWSGIELTQNYQHLIHQRYTYDFVGKSSGLNFKLLRESYSFEFLKELLGEQHAFVWSKVVLSGSDDAFVPPLYHFLAMGFLDSKVDDFAPNNSVDRIRNNSFYPCLNTRCDKFNHPTIKPERERSSKAVTARCTCKYVYEHNESQTLFSDLLFGHRTIEYGQEWLENFTRLWRNNVYDLYTIARSLATDPKRLVELAEDMGLGERDPLYDQTLVRILRKHKPPGLSISPENFHEACKATWLHILETDESLSYNHFIAAYPELLTWLTKNGSEEWIQDNLKPGMSAWGPDELL